MSRIPLPHHPGPATAACILGISILLLGSPPHAGETGDDVGRASSEGGPGRPGAGPTDRILLGAHYYPWYSSRRSRDRDERGWMSRALRGRLVPRQLPALGVYDSRDPKVIAEHIRQSRAASLDFWSVSWWGPASREDVALREHILPHPDASKLRFAVLYESTGRLGTFQEPDYRHWVSDFEYLRDRVWGHPLYLRVGGRPVVIVYLTREYFRGRGMEALRELREKVPEVWLVGDDVFGPRYPEVGEKLFDAITAYDVYGQSIASLGGTEAGIERLRRNYANAREIAARVGTAFVPAVAPGYNDRAVRDGHVGRPRYLGDREGSVEGDVFREMIRRVALPLADPKAERMVLVTSFNEWYEDSQIEATAGNAPSSRRDDSPSGDHYTQGDEYTDYGTLYLDILREEIRGRSSAASGADARATNEPLPK